MTITHEALARIAAVALLLAVQWRAAGAQPSPAPASDTLSVNVDVGALAGAINKGLLGVNHGPFAVHQEEAIFDGHNAVDLSAYYRKAGITSVRLDEFGAIDIQNVFPDFAADPRDPASYRFEPADTYLRAIRDLGAEIVFRMGYSEKPNRTEPPSDFDKWAEVMVQVIKHYNAGWANGHHWNIRYWEVWNEPSGLGWTGTVEEYCKLYATTVKKVKEYDPALLVGGPALGGPDPEKDRAFAAAFIQYCAEHRLPLDFFSWHAYFTRPQEQIDYAEHHKKTLAASGFGKTRMLLTEWGWLSGVSYPPPAEDLASIRDAAADIAAMAALHDRVDMAHFYVGGALAGYPWGLFDFVREGERVSVKPRKSFFAFKAFNLLAQGAVRLPCQYSPTLDDGGCAGLASIDEQKTRVAVLLSNYGTQVGHYSVSVSHLPWTAPTLVKVLALDSTRNLEAVREYKEPHLSGSPLALDVEKPSVYLILLTPADS